MPLQIDDPATFFADMPEDIRQQIFADMPVMGEMFETDPFAPEEEPFGFGDFALSAFNSLNPGANFAANVWNVGTGVAEDAGFDLNPFGAMNPNANFQTNAWKAARWAVNNIDFGDLFGGGESAEDESPAEDEGRTTLFTANGDPVEIDNAQLAESVEGEAVGEEAITSGVEELVGSIFDEALGSLSNVRSALAGGSLEKMVAQNAKRLAQRAISRIVAAL